MSEVAGRLAVQVGAWCLEAQNGGSGVLLSGASGVRPARWSCLGAGIAGGNSCQIAVGMGAQVSVIERNPNRLRYLHDVLGGQLTTLMSNRANIEEEVREADLVIGTVLIAGAKAPRLVTRRMVRSMRPGSAIVDVSIDQGGCVETARPTSHRKPIYVEEKVVHYAVTNMPGIVPHTSTYASPTRRCNTRSRSPTAASATPSSRTRRCERASTCASARSPTPRWRRPLGCRPAASRRGIGRCPGTALEVRCALWQRRRHRNVRRRHFTIDAYPPPEVCIGRRHRLSAP
jgi:hypothetical protein